MGRSIKPGASCIGEISGDLDREFRIATEKKDALAKDCGDKLHLM
jgi:hypothetical protein